MNLKKSLVSAVAGLALIGSIAAPVAQVSAGENGDETTATITITSDGEFDLTLTALDFGTQNLNAATGSPVLTGSLDMVYTDTKPSRGGFTTRVTATDFHGTTYNYANTIPVSNFLITGLPNPTQTLCCWTPNPANSVPEGGVTGISNVLMNTGSIPGTSTSSADWSPGVSFGANPYIHISDFAKVGRGTGQTTASADVQLTVPANTVPDTYSSTVTATVSFTAP